MKKVEDYSRKIDGLICKTKREYEEIEQNEFVTKFENIGLDSTGNNYMVDVDLVNGDNLTVYIDKKIFK